MTKLILLLFSMTLFACGQKGTSETTVPVTEVKKAPATTAPLFDADSAYAYVEKQDVYKRQISRMPPKVPFMTHLKQAPTRSSPPILLPARFATIRAT